MLTHDHHLFFIIAHLISIYRKVSAIKITIIEITITVTSASYLASIIRIRIDEILCNNFIFFF